MDIKTCMYRYVCEYTYEGPTRLLLLRESPSIRGKPSSTELWFKNN